MAQVDFSNAVLDVYSGNPMTASYMNLMNNSGRIVNEAGSTINADYTAQILVNTPTKVSILYTGIFNVDAGTSSTEFIISLDNSGRWRVSNISFSKFDTYAFVIDIETSGNT